MIYKNIFSIICMVLFVSGCKQGETISPRKIIYLSIEKSEKSEKLDVCVNAGSAKEIKLNHQHPSYEITLFEVRGGYSELFGSKFNIHDGLNTKRISIYLNELFVKSLSLVELENFKRVKFDTIYTHIIEL